MSLGIQELVQSEAGYASGHMVWAVLRKHFIAERKRLKVTQTAIAQKGQIDQSAISKIETDPAYTPQADTFLSAVEGMGLSLAQFFAGLENVQKGTDSLNGTDQNATFPAAHLKVEEQYDRAVPATAVLLTDAQFKKWLDVWTITVRKAAVEARVQKALSVPARKSNGRRHRA